MSWQDDIQEVKYISPSGNEFTFKYESVSMEVDKKTTEFIFSEIDGAYIQDNGRAGRRFPFTLYFVGESYNTDADAFMLALEEKGIAKLEHPIYGNRNVVPTGTITRRDDLIQGANQAVFDVSFSESFKDILFPSSTTDAENDLKETLDNHENVTSDQFAENVNTDDVLSKNVTINSLLGNMTQFEKTMRGVMRQSESLNAQFDRIMNSFENNVDNIVSDADIIARQLIKIIRLPSRIKTKMQQKTQKYSDMLTHYFSDFQRATTSLTDVFYSDKLNIDGAMGAACESVLYSDFSNRSEVISCMEEILDLYDSVSDFEDSNIDDLGIIDTGETYYSLLNIISKTAAYMISLSFDLPNEKRIVLGEERNCIELIAELYGDLNKLDQFILENDLNADEIEILPLGKEIVYYV